MAVAFAVVSLALAGQEAGPTYGSLFVVPNSTQPPARFSPGQYYNPATLSIRVDKGKPVLWPHKRSLKIGGLDLKERHLLVVISDGKPVQSFWFRFAQFTTVDLCVSFDGYQGVQLYEKKVPVCKCR